jgi:TonB-linked SusC/RagA family outer membrane protein
VRCGFLFRIVLEKDCVAYYDCNAYRVINQTNSKINLSLYMKSKFCLTLLGFLFCALSWGQTRQVIGHVYKENTNQPIPSATVRVKNGTATTTADTAGNFRINVPAGNTVLVVSSIGFSNTEIAVGNLSVVDVFMPQVISTMNDVVVIGYGTARKKDITGATSSISGSQLEKIPVSNVAEAITGRLAGVQVTTVDGAPGAEIVIRIRGGGSVTQDNSPLYIVDGFPVSNINDIATTDIASFNVLKDASSAAIYGAKGANGVVLITTKSAKGGKTVVSYNGFGQVKTLPRELDVLSPYEFVLAQYEYAKLRNDTSAFTKYFGVYGDLELYKNQKPTDWQKELFGKPIYSQQHNISVTGGNERTKISFSATENKDQGLMAGSNYERQYINFKLNHEVSRKVTIDLASRFSNAITNGAGTSGNSSVRIGDGITTRPINGLADYIDFSDLDVAAGDDEYEQFLRSLVKPTELAAQDYRQRKNKVFNMMAAVNWTIIRDMVYRSEFGLDLTYDRTKRYYGPLTGESKNVGGNLPLGELTSTEGKKYRWANTVTYNFKLGSKHAFTTLLGQELIGQSGFVEFNRAKYFNVNTPPDVLFANMQLGTPDGHTTRETLGENMSSFFGRVNYTLLDKYIFNVTTRADASSRFAPGNRWGVFPAVGVRWQISGEDFMKDVSFVSDLGLRASWGQAGNNRISDNSWRQIWLTSVSRTYGWGDINNTYWTPGSSVLPNPNIKWETTVTRNTGLDFSLFHNKLSGTFEAYWNTTKDLLVQQSIPQYTGYTSQIINIGQTSNRGLELSLNSTVISNKDFQLTVSFNAGTNKTRIDDLGGVNSYPLTSNWASTDLKSQDDYLFQVGRSIGLIYGYVTDGFYTADDFESYDPASRSYVLKKGVASDLGILGLSGSYFKSGTIYPGLLKLKDLDGDGFVTADKDRQIIGNALPKAQGGFGATANYKGFEGSLFFNWVYGNDVYNTGKISFNQYYRTTFGNMLDDVNSSSRFKYIDANGSLVTDLAELAKLNANASIWSPFSFGTATPVVHSWAIEDGSFLRLNNVTIGYSLPKKLISRVSMTKFKIYATVYNALLFTKYSGYDPEVSTTRNSGYSQLTPGVDYSAYPKSRSYTLGVNISF